MPPRDRSPSIAEVALDALAEAAASGAGLYVAPAALPRPLASRLRARAGEHVHALARGSAFPRAIEAAGAASRPVVVVPRLGVGGTHYGAVRGAAAVAGARFVIVALDGGAVGPAADAETPVIEDLGLMSTLPSLSTFVPADAGAAGPAVRAALARDGPTYLRLATGDRPSVGEPTFTPGHAIARRTGNDLSVIAVGPLVTRALEVADEIGKLGLGVRVLDAASVKPLDAKAVLRAAGETGAIITLEDHTSLAGIGSQVAGVTAENRPVPVIRLGVPDLFAGPVPELSGLDAFGLSKERVVEVALDLLRQRGKV